MNQEDSEHNEVDGMNKGADSTGEVETIQKQHKTIKYNTYQFRQRHDPYRA